HKTIAKTATYPKITILSPREYLEADDPALDLKAGISGAPSAITRAFYDLDDETSAPLKISGADVSEKLELSSLANGAHYLRFNFEDQAGKNYQKSVAFFVDNPKAPKQGTAKWRFKMDGASKATPLIFDHTVYVGANDGNLYAVNQETGNLEWKFDAGAEILTSAAIWKDTILFGAGNGKFFAVSLNGKLKWTYEGDHAIYSSPVVDKGVVYFGDNAAELVALNADTGKLLWKNTDASYSVESQPVVWSTRIFYGAWDGYLHCVDKDTSASLWKAPGPRNQETLNRYYAPADDGPVMAFGKLFAADRGYVAGEYDPVTGEFKKKISDDCSAIGLSANSKFLYLRGTKTPILKLNVDGEQLWESNVVAGRIPIAPVEVDGGVYVCTNSGRLCSIDARNGLLRWDYRVTPKLYVMSGVRVSDGIVFTTGVDGFLTAVVAPPLTGR
ncbi:MAG: PQQ-binding-like beta-propeller repeat protein, partial [bacterium]